MKTEYLTFTNKGILDLSFIKLMGVSVKEDSKTAIGYFGTGLKYAIATILRKGGDVSILSSGQVFRFSTKKIELRGKHFLQVLLDGEELSFTTELGKNWEAWMAVRELYSNALDEGGSMAIEEAPVGKAGWTKIIVEGEEFLKVYRNRSEFFIEKSENALYQCTGLDVLPPHSIAETSIFYKGIKVGEFNGRALYRYNFLTPLSLTEDRTIRYSFEVNEALETAIITSREPQFIRSCLVAPEYTRESSLDFINSYSDVEPSEEFMKTCISLSVQMPKNFNVRALSWLNNRKAKKGDFAAIEFTEIQKKQISKSIACIKELGYGDDIESYPIKLAHTLGHGVMGRALNGNIWLSRDCFQQGTKYVCSTILEELVHLKYGYSDHSRELQTWLFDKIVSLAEEFIIKEAL